MSAKILVVDDSETVRSHIAATLAQAGFEVLQACDGLDAIDRLEGEEDVRLVICDVTMPRMNGLELLERTKGQSMHAHLPFLMLTTEGRPHLMAQAKKAGARGWFVKPFKPEVLIQVVEKLVQT